MLLIYVYNCICNLTHSKGFVDKYRKTSMHLCIINASY
nr:MAG TPA: hypothetical protein [Caudoviricetes sp.]